MDAVLGLTSLRRGCRLPGKVAARWQEIERLEAMRREQETQEERKAAEAEKAAKVLRLEREERMRQREERLQQQVIRHAAMRQHVGGPRPFSRAYERVMRYEVGGPWAWPASSRLGLDVKV